MAIYLVQANVSANAEGKVKFQPKVMKGVFIPKEDTCGTSKIKKQCRQYLLNNLKESYPNLTFSLTNLKAEQYNSSFVLNEDSL